MESSLKIQGASLSLRTWHLLRQIRGKKGEQRRSGVCYSSIKISFKLPSPWRDDAGISGSMNGTAANGKHYWESVCVWREEPEAHNHSKKGSVFLFQPQSHCSVSYFIISTSLHTECVAMCYLHEQDICLKFPETVSCVLSTRLTCCHGTSFSHFSFCMRGRDVVQLTWIRVGPWSVKQLAVEFFSLCGRRC